MRVIFWDIDGVLNHPAIWGRWRGSIADALDPVIVVRAASVVRELDALCVLSSTWGHSFGLQKVIAALYDAGWFDVNERFIDRTTELWNARGMQNRRAEEIQNWLEAHPEFAEYAVVDDCPLGADTHVERFIKTDFNTGFTEADCARLRALFPTAMN